MIDPADPISVISRISWINRLSIKGKLILVIMAVSWTILIVYSIAMYGFHWANTRDRMVSELTITSNVIANNSAGALAFNDATDATQILHSLRSKATIEYAALYTADARLLASYRRDSTVQVFTPSYEETQGWVFQNNMLALWTPVVIEGRRIGSVYLQSNLNEFNEDLIRNLLVSLGLLTIATLLAFLLSTRFSRFISGPIFILTSSVDEVTKGNLATRVNINTHDEMGRLASGFNKMTETLQASVSSLQDTLANTEDAMRGQLVAQRQAEQAKDELEDVFASLPDLYCRMEMDGTVTDAQGRSESMFVVSSKEQLIGMKIQNVVPEELAPIFEEKVKAQAGLSEMQSWVYELRTEEGSGVRTFESGLTQSVRSNALILITRDITDASQTEKALRRSQKMDALGHLTGGIAHDYNNMLGLILGYSELLQAELVDQPELLEYADAIFYAGERSANLTKTLLSFSRSTATSKKILDINALLMSERSMLEKTLTAKVVLEFKLQEDLWKTKIDQGEFEDTIINMSINAKHAMQDEGLLVFTSSNQTIEATEAKYMELTPGQYVLLSVSDNGCGMSDEIKASIFDPFFSTKPADQGTGLGLSQVYGFVKRCGGHIGVYSEVGIGTRFSIYFPRATGTESPEEENEPQPSLQAENTDATILVVDDEQVLGNLTKEILAGAGYQVTCVSDTSVALDILSRETITLLVSDVIMPKLSGYELAERARELQPGIKIQLCSGFGGTDAKHMDDVLYQTMLSKPYTAVSLLQRVKTLLDEE
ncbi:MAG: response regulator [Halieaceae bacterium]|jgi:signal transduction histidine kinase/HAMP domain-containing protein|nr:response regulator [Halieaceae bacterium]